MNKNIWMRVVAIIISFLVIATIVFWFAPSFMINFDMRMRTAQDKWFAIYLDSGQIYYAHIAGWTGREMKLKDVYSLETVKDASSTIRNLVKREESEISKPENYLMVNRDKILYWEQIGERSQFFDITRETR